MKALLVHTRFRGGGAERCVRELFERLPGIGVEARLWVAVRSPDDPQGVESIRLAGERWLYPLNWLPTVNDWRHLGSRRRFAALTHRDADVVHLHCINGDWMSLGAAARLCRRFPVVWTVHDEWAVTGGLVCDLTRVMELPEVEALSRRMPPRDGYHWSFHKRLLRRRLSRHPIRPAVMICPSHHIRGLAQKSGWYEGVNLRVIRHGVAMLAGSARRMDRAEARAALGLPREGRVVALVAPSFGVPHKGIHLAAPALGALAREVAPSVLVIGRHDPAVVRALSPLRVVSRFAANDDELARAYRAADVTMIPSLSESLSLVMLESFACETPVSAFDVGGLGEVVAESGGGLLAHRFSTDELASNTDRLLADAALRRQLGERGRAWVEQNCDMGRYLDATVAVYREAMAARNVATSP